MSIPTSLRPLVPLFPLGTLLLIASQQAVTVNGDELEKAAQKLPIYRSQLDAFRMEYGGTRPMPHVPFFQFGMGLRAKYLFKNGTVREIVTGKEVRHWTAVQTLILPSEYSVVFETTEQGVVRIVEDEAGVWIEESSQRRAVPGTETPLHLPEFAEHRYGLILRELHHEILMNVVEGRPVPNLYVYRKPWFRDGAMMAMCLAATGNLDLIRPWILNLREVFDRNNGGEAEADNPGQVLYLVSLVSDKQHPVVPRALEALKALEVTGHHGVYIKGRSDFSEHPVYQTKWAKFGLRALGLPDLYEIPQVRDSYSSLFWMDYRERHVPGGEAANRDRYPYLGWATDHFQNRKLSPISDQDYPLTWETQASQADYSGLVILDPQFVKAKTAAPHTWHAAEVFLYLLATGPALSTAPSRP